MKTSTVALLIFYATSTIAAEIDVYKSPTCGCCQKWVEALESEGHKVNIYHPSNLNFLKQEVGLPIELGSCHTALVEGYVVEGHVPPSAIEKLLSTKPNIKGIAVPNMPAESVGMEYGAEPEEYTVYSFDEAGTITPISKYIGANRID